MVLVSGVDYLPFGRGDISNLNDSECAVLFRIVLNSDHENMFQAPRPSGVDEELQSLQEKGYINHDETLVYLNFENDLFKHFLASETIYNINKENNNTIATKPKKTKPKKVIEKKEKKLNDHLKEKKWQDRISIKHIQVLEIINEGRTEIGVSSLKRWSASHEEAISNVLKNYSYEDVLKGIRQHFSWPKLKESQDISFKNKVTQPKVVFGKGFEGKLWYAEQAKVSIKDIDVPIQKSTLMDSVSNLFNSVLENWDRIQNKKVKIQMEGELCQIKIASLAYKKFKSKLNGKDPKYLDEAENLFRESYEKSKEEGGARINALDDLYINGRLYSVEVIQINV